MLIALAFSLQKSGNSSDAKSAFERASKIDPSLAFRYPLGGAGVPPEKGRASKEGDAPDLFSEDWAE
jgi:hypothetical protein